MIEDDGSWREIAQRHLAEGRPAEAVELYREHFRASRGVPALAGTRLVSWLAEWVDLGSGYPPALEALRWERSAAVQRLLGEDGNGGQGSQAGSISRGLAALDDFTEVAAISARLGEPQYPIELFVALDARRPDVAEDCAAQARRLLVRAGRFDLARRYLRDPLEVVTRVAAVFEQRLTRGFVHAPEGMREHLRQRAVDDYLAAVREILAVLTGVGEHDVAARVQQRAIDAVPWAHVREDIEAAFAPAE